MIVNRFYTLQFLYILHLLHNTTLIIKIKLLQALHKIKINHTELIDLMHTYNEKQPKTNSTLDEVACQWMKENKVFYFFLFISSLSCSFLFLFNILEVSAALFKLIIL